jgi:N-acetylglucosaminyl-diphospho-decaprenol L-rhamnosyltransferase
MPHGPPVTVAIVSWNTRELLRRCLVSFADEAATGRAAVWVVDNASSDGSAQLVRDEFRWAQLVASDENLGFGAAVNLVARRTDSPWLAIANADIALEPSALDALLRAGEADPGAGAIAPRLVLPDGTTQHSVFAFPTLALALVVNSGIGRLVPRLGDRFALLGGWDEQRARRVPWAIAAFLLVRREAWDAVGGFDERQWMYAEDLDLGWRLRRAGWATRYEPAARVAHESAASTEQAFGSGGKVARWQRSTYAWMLWRLGPIRTRAVAALNLGGSALRFAVMAVAAAVAPRRFRARRDAERWWIGVHRAGLARRRVLEAHR